MLLFEWQRFLADEQVLKERKFRLEFKWARMAQYDARPKCKLTKVSMKSSDYQYCSPWSLARETRRWRPRPCLEWKRCPRDLENFQRPGLWQCPLRPQQFSPATLAKWVTSKTSEAEMITSSLRLLHPPTPQWQVASHRVPYRHAVSRIAQITEQRVVDLSTDIRASTHIILQLMLGTSISKQKAAATISWKPCICLA